MRIGSLAGVKALPRPQIFPPHQRARHLARLVLQREQMAFGVEDKAPEMLQNPVGLVKEQIEILERLGEEVAVHAVTQGVAPHVMNLGVAAFDLGLGLRVRARPH